MSLPCIAHARRFEPCAHRPFFMASMQVGWIREGDVGLLARWPDVFEIDAAHVTLAARFDADANSRSAALGAVIGALAGQGRIPGWRDETYAIRNAFDAAPLAVQKSGAQATELERPELVEPGCASVRRPQ